MASAILLGDDAQVCTSLSDVTWDLDYEASGAYDGPDARELSRRCTSGLALLEYRSACTDRVELDGRLKHFQPGTAAVRMTGFAAEATVRAATQASTRQVLARPVDLGRPIPSRGRGPGGRDRPAQDWQGRAHRGAAGLFRFMPHKKALATPTDPGRAAR
jgi:DNA-binding NtrC family response regulator